MRLSIAFALLLVAGFTAVSDGATQRRSNCKKGQFSPRSGVKCELCGPGTYADQTGSTRCRACPPGHEARGYGNVLCTACRRGYHAARSGSSNCIMCRAGYAASEYGSRSCMSCPPGQHSNKAGSERCVKCPANHYSPAAHQIRCLPCRAGSHAKPGSAKCTLPGGQVWALTNGACPSDTYSVGHRRCKSCDRLPAQNLHRCYTRVKFSSCRSFPHKPLFNIAQSKCNAAFDGKRNTYFGVLYSRTLSKLTKPFFMGYLPKAYPIKRITVLTRKYYSKDKSFQFFVSVWKGTPLIGDRYGRYPYSYGIQKVGDCTGSITNAIKSTQVSTCKSAPRGNVVLIKNDSHGAVTIWLINEIEVWT